MVKLQTPSWISESSAPEPDLISCAVMFTAIRLHITNLTIPGRTSQNKLKAEDLTAECSCETESSA